MKSIKRCIACMLCIALLISMFIGLGALAAGDNDSLPEADGDIDKVYPLYPHNEDFSHVLTYSLAIDYGGLMAGDPNRLQGTRTLEDTLQYMEEIDNLTRGVKKIIRVVGYQEGGHDWQYPQWTPPQLQI